MREPYDGAVLKRRRLALGWSPAELARRAHMSDRQILNIEEGRSRSSFDHTRAKLERALLEGEQALKSKVPA